MTQKIVQLKTQDKTIELPLREGTLGPSAIDVTTLQKNDVFTYDPGFMSTAACESKITFIDGDKGILLYRGYPIEQLAEHSDFMEVCYLLLHGNLTTKSQKGTFITNIKYHTLI